MKQVINNRQKNLSREQLLDLASEYEKVILDIGTGDGRFVYKQAIENPQNLYIGVEPAVAQLAEYSKKAQKNDVGNVIFVLGSVEVYPEELFGIADDIFIILPWGSLLKAIVEVDVQVFEKINKSFKNGGKLEVIFGYSQDAEKSEVKRLGLNKLNTNHIYSHIIPNLMKHGFKIACVEELSQESLFEFDSTWAKRLTFGSDRPLFSLKVTH